MPLMILRTTGWASERVTFNPGSSYDEFSASSSDWIGDGTEIFPIWDMCKFGQFWEISQHTLCVESSGWNSLWMQSKRGIWKLVAFGLFWGWNLFPWYHCKITDSLLSVCPTISAGYSGPWIWEGFQRIKWPMLYILSVSISSIRKKRGHTNVHPNVYHHYSVDKPTLPSAWNNFEAIHMSSIDTQHDATDHIMHTELLLIDLLPDPVGGHIQHTWCGNHHHHQVNCCQV